MSKIKIDPAATPNEPEPARKAIVIEPGAPGYVDIRAVRKKLAPELRKYLARSGLSLNGGER